MSNMFSGCYSLKYLDLSNFNTENVTDMSNMFSGCSSLKKLDLSRSHTQKDTNMVGMFSLCSSLELKNIKTRDKNIFNEYKK